MCQQFLKSFHFCQYKNRSKFLDHSEVFDTVDWLFKARSAQTIAYTVPKNQDNGSFPSSDILTLLSRLQNTEKNVNFASPLKIQRLNSFNQLQGPLDRAGALP